MAYEDCQVSPGSGSTSDSPCGGCGETCGTPPCRLRVEIAGDRPAFLGVYDEVVRVRVVPCSVGEVVIEATFSPVGSSVPEGASASAERVGAYEWRVTAPDNALVGVSFLVKTSRPDEAREAWRQLGALRVESEELPPAPSPSLPTVEPHGDGTCTLRGDLDGDGEAEPGEPIARVPCLRPSVETGPDDERILYEDTNWDGTRDEREPEYARTPGLPRERPRSEHDGHGVCSSYYDANGNGRRDPDERGATYPCASVWFSFNDGECRGRVLVWMEIDGEPGRSQGEPLLFDSAWARCPLY